MHVNRITLRGFRSHQDTTIEGLARNNIFFGTNGAGKSSILEALGYALTGTCQGTDDGGRGAEDLVRQVDGTKAPSSHVSLETDKGELARMVGQGPRSAVQARANTVLGVSEDVARVVVQPGNFLELAPAAQKAMLTATIGSKVTRQEILDLVPASLAAEVDWPRMTTIEAVDMTDKQLRAERPELKAQINGFGSMEAEPPMPCPGDPESVLSAAAEQLAQLRRDREAYLRRINDTRGRQSAMQDELSNALEELAGINEELAGAPNKAEIEQKLKDLAGEISVRQAKAKNRSDLAATLRSQIEQLRAQLAEIKAEKAKIVGLKGECPTCRQSVSANYSKQVFEVLDTKEKKLLAIGKAAAKKLEDEGQPTLEEDPSPLQQDVVDLNKSLVDLEHCTRRKAELEQKIGPMKTALADFKTPTDEAFDMDESEDRIKKGEEFIDKVKRHITIKERNAGGREKRKQLEDRLRVVEAIIELIGPKGPIRSKLLAGGLGDFVSQVNELASAFGLPEVAVDLEPWRILAAGRRAALLSASERYRLGLCFAGVFAKRSGAGILCLDGADILDGAGRSMLPQVLEICGLDQAFVASTSDEEPGEPPEGWSFYHVVKDEQDVSRVYQKTAAGR